MKRNDVQIGATIEAHLDAPFSSTRVRVKVLQYLPGIATEDHHVWAVEYPKGILNLLSLSNGVLTTNHDVPIEEMLAEGYPDVERKVNALCKKYNLKIEE